MKSLHCVLTGLLLLASACAPITPSYSKKPVYLDCQSDGITIVATNTKLSWNDLQAPSPSNALQQLLISVKTDGSNQYVVALVRPDSIRTYRTLRRKVEVLGAIEFSAEPMDSGTDTTRNCAINKGSLRPFPNHPVSGATVFFECRTNEVFYIDKKELEKQKDELLAKLKGKEPNRRDLMSDLREWAKTNELGNTYYSVRLPYLLTAILALQPRTDVRGESISDLAKPSSAFSRILDTLDRDKQCVVFFVRDDSFPVLRKARSIAEAKRIQVSWDLLSTEEPIKFGYGGSNFGCIAEGALIMTEGGTCPIEQVILGDKVWSYNTSEQTSQLSVLRSVRSLKVQNVLEINHRLRLTRQHPVWVDGQWLPAGLIQLGQQIVGFDNQPITVESIESIDGEVTVYDLSVDFPNTFFADGILVHNKS